jgi:hypothetical protein
MYEGVDALIHVFPCRFTPGKGPMYSLDRRLGGPHSRCGIRQKAFNEQVTFNKSYVLEVECSLRTHPNHLTATLLGEPVYRRLRRYLPNDLPDRI